MLPKQEIEQTLIKHFAGAFTKEKIQAVAEELSSLENEWEEVDIGFADLGLSVSVQCSDICYLADHLLKGDKIKFFRKKGLINEAAGQPVSDFTLY